MGKMNETVFEEKREIIKLIFSFSNAHENGVILKTGNCTLLHEKTVVCKGKMAKGPPT